MQNQLLEIIKEIQELSISTPLSFRDAMEKKEGIKRFEFDDATIKALNDYWENTGKYIRDLRDVDEHFDALVDHTYFELKSDPGQILMFFPDNPECKSSKRFTYVRENDAYEIIANNLQEINRIIESICEAKGLPPQQHQASIMLSHMGDLTEEQERTLGLMMVVTKVDKTEKGNHVHLDTIETMQVIPDKEKGIGNIAFRKLKTDNEIEPQD
ncbi:MAG: hypothetical protein DHS20C08_13570 [Rhodomicrobium sp.]|nr:MAG: hypothetical protein DHS20C08_13570 [Rhodomicrobium sp.]